jgi:hypothetical protein
MHESVVALLEVELKTPRSHAYSGVKATIPERDLCAYVFYILIVLQIQPFYTFTFVLILKANFQQEKQHWRCPVLNIC